MQKVLNAADALTEMRDVLDWLSEPKTIKEFQEKMGLGRVAAKNWIDGWCQRGWIRPAGYVRFLGRGRPAMAYVTDTKPKSIDDLLAWKFTPREVTPHGDPWLFSEEMRLYFAEPRTVYDYRKFIGASWPTAKTHMTRWLEDGHIFCAGLIRRGHAPPAQAYCADPDETRKAVFRSAMIEYVRWQENNPGADIDTWEG